MTSFRKFNCRTLVIASHNNNKLVEFLKKFDLEGEFYKGKVRDNYFDDDTITMITSDRVSAFDHVLGTIPFKGQILSEITNYWFKRTENIVPNHIISFPDPQVLVVKKAKTLPVEVIVKDNFFKGFSNTQHASSVWATS